jgi:hypothetical protein
VQVPLGKHPNQQFTYDNATGAVKQDGMCLTAAAAQPRPGPAGSRNISVTWEQLGYTKMGAQVRVRDLWSKTDKTETVTPGGGIDRAVALHEVKIFTFTRL